MMQHPDAAPLAGAVAPHPASLAAAVVAGVAAYFLLRALLRRGQAAQPASAQPDPGPLTYREAIEYFVNAHPKDDAVVRGVLLRRAEGRRFRVDWRFLDKENNICGDSRHRPYGKSELVTGFDDELNGMFGDADVLVVN